MAEKITQEAIEQAPDVTPDDVLDHEAILDELAQLSPIAYDQCRRDKAKLLNIRVTALDGEVAKRRPQTAQPDAQGTQVIFETPQLWLLEVQGADLLDELAKVYNEHLILLDGGAEALALWTVHTYTYEASNITPRLGITSPLRRCGKTRVLEALSLTCPRVLLSSNATPAAIFRAIELWRPTLLMDEADTVLPGNEELRGILNSGHTRRTAFVLRTVGDNHEPRQFSTWAPLAIAMIGNLPGTLADRSIVLPMRRKRRDEKVKPLPLDANVEPFAGLRSKCARWAADNFDTLREALPTVPAGLHDRAADNWRPLCAIAEVAGGDWPTRIKKAIAALTVAAPEDDEMGVLLLKDMQHIFEQQKMDAISSEDLAHRLHTMEERPWPEYGKQRKPISAPQIARLLKPFEIRPRNIRIEGAVPKGYRLDACQDAFQRYISPLDPPFQTATPLQPSNNTAKRENLTATDPSGVAVRKSHNPALILTCSDVAVSEGGIEGDIYMEHSPSRPDSGDTQPCPQCSHPLRTVVGEKGVYCVHCRYRSLVSP
jgi:putative DNA primase/helicase